MQVIYPITIHKGNPAARQEQDTSLQKRGCIADTLIHIYWHGIYVPLADSLRACSKSVVRLTADCHQTIHGGYLHARHHMSSANFLPGSR
jgi:hypothetical protein